MQYESVKDNCLERWQCDESDPRIEHFIQCFKDFNDKLPQDLDNCVEIMLMRFCYYSHMKMNNAYKLMHSELISTYNLDIDKSVFSVLKSQKPKLNSSYLYLFEYKMLNNLSKYSCIPELSDLFNSPNWNSIDNIVFVDDICGTGKTFNDFILSVKERIVNKTIYYVVIHIMAEAKERIERIAKDNDMEIIVVSHNTTKAAFSYDDLNKYKEQFIRGSNDLGIIRMKEILGFDYCSEEEHSYSESLVAFYENTPNNTLGIFWKNTEKNKPLFPREDDPKPQWQVMGKRKHQKSESNYFRITRDINE